MVHFESITFGTHTCITKSTKQSSEPI